MSKETIILFDVGAVLVRLDCRGFYREAAKISQMSSEEIESRYVQSNLDQRSIGGQIQKKEFYRKLRDIINPTKKLRDEELKIIVAYIWPGQIDEMIALKEQLHKNGYSVGIFSNIADFAYEIINENYPAVFNVFNPKAPKILSYKIKAMKPKPAMYKAVKGYNQIILIDDKDQYLQVGIEQFGWKGIHFIPYIDSAEPLRKMHPDKGNLGQECIVAKNVQEVKAALKVFGVFI